MNLRTLLLFLCAAVGASSAVALDYHRDVAPIFRQYCAGCHNDTDAEGDFSLETYAALLEGGESGAVLVPGKPEESLLVRTVQRKEKPYMPPRKKPQPPAELVATLEAWISQGASGPGKEADASILAELTVPEVAPADGHPKPATALALLPDGRSAVARYASVMLGETALEGLSGKVTDLAVSRDGTLIAAASGLAGLNGKAAVWDTATGEPGKVYGADQHRDLLYAVAFSPDASQLATAGYDRVIRLWDRDSATLLREFRGHNGAVYDLAFSPDGVVLASASGDESVKLWRVSDGERLDTLGQPEGEQFAVVFTPDGRHILSAGADKRIHLWRWTSRKEAAINPLRVSRFAHEDEVVRLALTADGKRLASASADGTIRLWSVPDLAVQHTFDLDGKVVADLRIEDDGKHLRIARMDGALARLALPAPAAATTAAPATAATAKRGADGTAATLTESEPNDTPETAASVSLPAEFKGHIQTAGDVDLLRFSAKAGETWILEVDAARSKSPLDAKVSVRHADGSPVLRTRLQAVRESWLTFRGKNSSTSGDFRVHNWRRMELNELLYVNGEVVKLWLYPRGPDSGFIVYPGRGSRRTYFDTSSRTHPLGQPAYIVEELPAGAEPIANGLPMFPVYYENDDDAWQRLKRDSKLFFTAPADGEYLARVEDVRGAGGKDFSYTLKLRVPKPEFNVTYRDIKDGISPGSGKEVGLSLMRADGFENAVRLEFENLPAGFSVSEPVAIGAGQTLGQFAVYAAADAANPAEDARSVAVFAVTTIDGKPVRRKLRNLGGLMLGKAPELRIELAEELEIAPGETVTTRLKLVRGSMKGAVSFGKEFAGRNMPHGVFVDNIGLNGLFVPEGQDEREFQITAAPWVQESERMVFINTGSAGGQASSPIRLRIRKTK